MNINNILIISKFFVMRLTQNQKNQSTQYNSMVMLFKKIALWYSLLHNLRTWFCVPIQWRCKLAKEKYHIYKELIRIIMAFEYKKLLLLKSPENKVASKLRSLKKKTKQTCHICQGHYEIKLLILQMSQ